MKIRDIRLATEMYLKQGKTLDDIVKVFGVSHYILRKCFKEHGVSKDGVKTTRRPPMSASKLFNTDEVSLEDIIESLKK